MKKIMVIVLVLGSFCLVGCSHSNGAGASRVAVSQPKDGLPTLP